jgi:hypothetical protein
MIFCPHCQEPVPDGSLMCRKCQTPIDHSRIVAGNLQATKTAEYVVGGINWGAVIVGALIAIAIWDGGMYALVTLLGPEMVWFGIIVKVSAISIGSLYAGYRSYSAELSHGLLVAGLVAVANGAFYVLILGFELTMTLILIDFIFIDLLAALAGAFFGAKMQG